MRRTNVCTGLRAFCEMRMTKVNRYLTRCPSNRQTELESGTSADLEEEQSTSTMCFFWMARAGRSDPALLRQSLDMFEELLGYANHVGLFQRELTCVVGLQTTFLRPFHFSLISAAFCLDRIIG